MGQVGPKPETHTVRRGGISVKRPSKANGKAYEGATGRGERPRQRPSGAECANGALDMEHGLEIQNVGRRGPLADGRYVALGRRPIRMF